MEKKKQRETTGVTCVLRLLKFAFKFAIFPGLEYGMAYCGDWLCGHGINRVGLIQVLCKVLVMNYVTNDDD